MPPSQTESFCKSSCASVLECLARDTLKTALIFIIFWLILSDLGIFVGFLVWQLKKLVYHCKLFMISLRKNISYSVPTTRVILNFLLWWQVQWGYLKLDYLCLHCRTRWSLRRTNRAFTPQIYGTPVDNLYSTHHFNLFNLSYLALPWIYLHLYQSHSKPSSHRHKGGSGWATWPRMFNYHPFFIVSPLLELDSSHWVQHKLVSRRWSG